ncbi:hypothetical protein DPMN_144581 [Dreissena polymorpha]|uniref:Uncharacterized protein n=1 Tax=Dreissena polymorpha TaxID=45954 RepID=A0A9D4GF51_DREPO|nr:hypothetical protein DPMN_144581 [Dreissena polymorpha]
MSRSRWGRSGHFHPFAKAGHSLGQLLERARRDRGERELLRSVTLEPDVFHTAGIAVFSKMQRTCHPLFIVESSPARTCQRSRLKRAGGGGTARPPVWGTYGTDLGLTYTQEHRGGGFKEGPRDSGTQYAQRTGETVSGMKTTAGDSERGHKGRAACLHSFGGAAYRQEFGVTNRPTDRPTDRQTGQKQYIPHYYSGGHKKGT